MVLYKPDSEARAILMRKLMCICPLCGKLIFGRDIDITKIENGDIRNWPVEYIHSHSHNNVPHHDLTLYIDANFAVRERVVLNKPNL